MNSLRDLNDYAEDTVITITDNRDATVIFDRTNFADMTTTFSSATIPVTPNFNIEEVVNYSTANCRYRISIISNSSTFIANSYITWASAFPAGVSLSGSGGVYTLTGVNSKTVWNAVKTFTWSLPANWNTYTSFYLRMEVIYYDEELSTTETKTVEYYDPIYYPISKFQTTSSLSCAITYNITSPAAALSVNSFAFMQGDNFIPFVGFTSSTSLSATIKANKTVTSNNALTFTSSTNVIRNITPMIVRTGQSPTGSYLGFLKVFKYSGGTYTDYGPDASTWNTPPSGYTAYPRAVAWAGNAGVQTGYLAVFVFYDPTSTGNIQGKIIFYKNSTNFSKLSVEITPPLGPEVTKMRWNYDGTILSWADSDDRVSSALITSSSYTMLTTPSLRDGSSTSALAWHPSSNVLAISSSTSIDLLTLSGTSLSYINNSSTNNFNPTTSKRYASDMDWHPSGNTLASVGGPLTIYNFDGSKLNYVTVISSTYGSYSSVAWSPSGVYLAVASATNRPNESYSWSYALRVYKKSGDTYTEIAVPEPSNRINSLSWNGDSSILSVSYQSFAGNYTGYVDNYLRSGDTFTKTTPSLIDGTGTVAWRKN